MTLYPEHAESVLLSLVKKNSVSIRVNTVKATSRQVEQALTRNNLAFSTVSWCSDAYIIENTTAKVLTETTEYEAGHFYIQGLSSLVPTLALHPKPEEYILDITAAPGSKTSHIAALMNNTGKIIANDTSRTRLYKLEANMKRLGITNVSTSNHPGERLWEKYHNIYDKVLLDAPCSMEGMFEADDPKTYDHWSQKKVKRLAKQQRWLLRSALSCVKPGGIVIYSTCTISPEENEGVLEWLQRKYPHLATIEPLDVHPDLLQKAGPTGVPGTLRLLPDEHFEAFFVARLRRNL